MKNKLSILAVLLSITIIECVIFRDWIGAGILTVALYYNILAYREYMGK
jgi:hypothetical protein